MKFLIIISLMVVSVFGFDVKLNNKIKTLDYEYTEGKYVTNNNRYFNENTNLMVSFNNNEANLIKEFELKHNLLLVKKLVTGYSIYKSDNNIFDKIDEVLQDDKNIKSIFPAWKRKVQRY